MCRECQNLKFILPSQAKLEYYFALPDSENPFCGSVLPLFICSRCYGGDDHNTDLLMIAEQALRIQKGEHNV